MRITKAKSEVLPQNKVERLAPNRYSCRICDNIESIDGGYSFDSYRESFTALTYQELLVNIIHTRYTYDDENNFINDFLTQGMNNKYKVYRDFVSWAKETAKSYFKEG